MSYRKYLYFVEDVRFRKYVLILVTVCVLVGFVYLMSGFFAKDECSDVMRELNDTSLALSECRSSLSDADQGLESCGKVRDDFIVCKNALDSYGLTGGVPLFSGDIGSKDIFGWTVFGGVKLWMLLVLVPAMVLFQLFRIFLQVKSGKKLRNLLWLDVVWIFIVLIYLTALFF